MTTQGICGSLFVDSHHIIYNSKVIYHCSVFPGIHFKQAQTWGMLNLYKLSADPRGIRIVTLVVLVIIWRVDTVR